MLAVVGLYSRKVNQLQSSIRSVRLQLELNQYARDYSYAWEIFRLRSGLSMSL